MPMYFLRLCDTQTFSDEDGTELANVAQARAHAIQVARELAFKSTGIAGCPWAEWTMSGHDDEGTELFSFPDGGFPGVLRSQSRAPMARWPPG